MAVRCTILLSIVWFTLLSGCESAPRNLRAIHAYYDYDFVTAREGLREDAYGPVDEQTLLNRGRLGLASLADGDHQEAERNLLEVFDLLSTAGLNEDRTVAAVLTHEGARIWKGEPFEQALLYHYTALLFALQGDWENTRAAAANALFRLSDFGEEMDKERLARTAVAEDADPGELYEAVESDFILGMLMQAIGSDLSGLGGAGPIYDRIIELDRSRGDVVEVFRRRDYDTLLVIDFGKGPTKIAYGRDDVFSRFESQDIGVRTMSASVNGEVVASVAPICNVNAMAEDLRWNHFEDVRVAKSVLGDALLIGGTIVAGTATDSSYRHGKYSSSTDWGQVAAGLGMIMAGALSKSGAKADTRYLEFVPQSIYVVPVRLGATRDITLSMSGSGEVATLNDVQPGTTDDPRVYALRLLRDDVAQPRWLTRATPVYGNDVTGVREGDYPWILGGHDVSTPTRAVLAAYQANGYLTGWTLDDLRALYAAEGIVFGSGAPTPPGDDRNPAYRHILEGGRALFTPAAHSTGYRRLMYQDHGAYAPTSSMVRPWSSHRPSAGASVHPVKETNE